MARCPLPELATSQGTVVTDNGQHSKNSFFFLRMKISQLPTRALQDIVIFTVTYYLGTLLVGIH